MITQKNQPVQNTYKPGHPWYYKLGGAVHKPKAILTTVKNSRYQGYKRDDINRADDRAEPQRSSSLRSLREEALTELRSNLEIYRGCACELREYRLLDENEQDAQPMCADIHTSMSLKYNHLYNDFAHLIMIDDLLSQQRDLFA